MADLGAKYTAEQIAAVEKQVKQIYLKAYKETLEEEKKWKEKQANKWNKLQEKFNNGQISAPEFIAQKKAIFSGPDWASQKKHYTNIYYNANKTAVDILNGNTQNVFMYNANFANYSLEHDAGVSFGFGLYDQNTVSKLLSEQPTLLPPKKVNSEKDQQWNNKKINSAVTMGIVKGESLDDVSKRLADSLHSGNYKAMKNTVSTAMTAAQNSGRQTSYEKAAELGIKIKKQWMATLDDRTRITHQKLDGQTVALDESFHVNGYLIKFPGDPDAHPSLVYGCRCVLVSELEDYPATYDRYDNIDGKPIANMSYDEWKDAKQSGKDIAPKPLTWSITEPVPKFTGPSKDLIDAYGNKAMSAVYNEFKAAGDTKSANGFYKDLKSMGKPSEVWSDYVSGQLSEDDVAKIEKWLKQMPTGLPAGDIDFSLYGGKDAFDMLTKYADYDDMLFNAKMHDMNDLIDTLKKSPQYANYTDHEKLLSAAISDAHNSQIKAAAANPLSKKTPSGKIPKLDNQKNISELANAQDKLTKAQQALDNTNADKVYSGIWKNDVKVSDYPMLKDSIPAKKKWYDDQIMHLEIDEDILEPWEKDKLVKYKKYLKDLEEFEENGKKYQVAHDAWKSASAEVKALTPKVEPFDPMNYTVSAKNAANAFSDRDKADKLYRSALDANWNNLDDKEKYAVWEYTRNSNPINRSLSGYHETWSRSNYIGPLNTEWGYENKYRTLPSAFNKFGKSGRPSYFDVGTNLTNTIEQFELSEAAWFVRGTDRDGLAGLVADGFSNLDFEDVMHKLEYGTVTEVKSILEGQTFMNHAFTSTGIAKGTGFTYKPVLYDVYAPAGAKCIYAEPQSYFGGTIDMDSRLYAPGQKYTKVESEAEMIFQRGTEFRITKVDKSGGTWKITMEVVNQPDYFKTGSENTADRGKTKHKK